MSIRTQLIGIAFICFLFFGAIIVDVLNWPNWLFGIPAILLEFALCGSAGFDLIYNNENC
jgi:hypothetical protein